MFNPLNNQIADLLSEIERLQAERDRQEKSIDYRYPLSTQPLDVIERIKPILETIDRLTRTVDAKRQQVISLELLMLDNSIKDLHSITSQVDASIKSLQSTTSQVDSSVKSLQETSLDVLKSSNKLERLTLILVMVTILVALTGIFSVAVVYLTINQLVGSIGIDATFVGFMAFIVYSIPIIRKLRKS